MELNGIFTITNAVMKQGKRDTTKYYPMISLVETTTGEQITKIANDEELVNVAKANMFKPCQICFEFNEKYGSLKIVDMQPVK